MDNQKPSLVFIASRYPFPLEKGDKLRSYLLIKGHSASHSITLIALSNEPICEEWKAEIEPFVHAQHIFKLNRFFQFFRTGLALFSNQPFQLAYFTSFVVKQRIKQLITQIQPDHVFCQMIRPAEYIKNYHVCHKTIDYMDALSVGMERRALNAPITTRWIYKMEASRLKEYEQRIFNYFEYQTMITKQDTQYIAHPDQRKITVIPNGIDTSYFFPQPETKKTVDLVFVGNLSYAPNVNAMQWFVVNIMQHHPEWTLLIAGANPSNEIIQLGKQHKNITIEGWQADIRNAYARGKVFIAPMQIGTGMQNKLLEAMAMGLPCITTPLASDALEARDKHELLVAMTVLEFEQNITILLTGESDYKHLGMQGRKFVETNYSWSQAIKRLSQILNTRPESA